MTALVVPALETERLRLRPFEDGDAGDLVALMSDAHVLRYWDAPAWTDPGRSRFFLDTCRRMAQEGTGVRPAVVRRSDGRFLGWCTLNSWNPGNRTAELGYCYARPAWGRGFATEAAGALLRWGFDTLDLHRVTAETDTRNAESGRVLTKLGFVHEGTLREDLVVDGTVTSSHVYGLLRREFASLS